MTAGLQDGEASEEEEVTHVPMVVQEYSKLV
jgi:hypothetical protein